jgi:hypothetical protein
MESYRNDTTTVPAEEFEVASRVEAALPPILARYGLAEPLSTVVRLTNGVGFVRLVFAGRVPGYAADELTERVREVLRPATIYPNYNVVTVQSG